MLRGAKNEEIQWAFKVVVAVDSAGVGQEKCSRPHAQVAIRNAKFLSNPAVTGRFTAKSASRNAKSSSLAKRLLAKGSDCSKFYRRSRKIFGFAFLFDGLNLQD